MKITVKSAAAFKQQLLDAGMPASQVAAAVKLVKDKGVLKAGQSVTIPDRFMREDGAAASRKATGDVATRGKTAPAAGNGRSMGTLGIHAFDDVRPVDRRTGRVVDACGSSELSFGGEFRGVDACGGSAPVRTTGRRRAEPAEVESRDPPARPSRRRADVVDACGGSVTPGRRYSNGGAC